MAPRSNADFDRAARYVAIRRRHPSPEVKDRREAALDQADDWTATCPYCKVKLRGTRAELLTHSCREYEDSNAPGL